ncbi:uncharacterized protein LOC132282319 isoform X2 [Cornus florida]|uniref:uncharacterized protein LOC132282319 isoform X2 n=1 Tax=Cornus florida TaxID=4283 RepID=UPI0028964ECD|nr:uncharacterized protein LOC132282319 isoform X2 [Cornus florida]
MAAKPLTTEAIALTEKKMDMALDDIIKMSKTTTTKAKKQRVSNKSQKNLNTAAQEKSAKMRRFMDSRSSLRQGALARRRSNFQGNQFPLATEAARKAAVVPLNNRPFNRSRAVNINKSRVGAPPVQRKAANGRFALKQSQQQLKVVPKQRPQTLDSLFANMKEQRMRVLSQQSNGGRQNGGGRQRQQWGRGGGGGRFGN